MAFPDETTPDHFPIFPAPGSHPTPSVRTRADGAPEVVTDADLPASGGNSRSDVQTPAGTRFTPRRSNLWALRLGYWFGRGYSAKDAAELTREGTSEGTAKGQLRRAGLCPSKPRQVVVPIELPSWQRDAIATKAAELGITMEMLLQRVVESGLVLDALYAAICDDRYESGVSRATEALDVCPKPR